MSVTFEGYERRIRQIEAALKEYGIDSLEAARDLCLARGIDVDKIVKDVQPIAFENAVWAYTLGAAIALKKEGCRPRGRTDRSRVAGFLHSRLGCGFPQGRHRTRQSGGHAAAR